MKRSKTGKVAKSTRSKKSPAAAGKKPRQAAGPAVKAPKEVCKACGKDVTDAERALFVEEEVGRVFCSEACIANYFAPDIDRLEKEYLRYRNPEDLNAEQAEKFAHLKWMTLQEPDEIWRQKTIAGDYRYTLISEFQPGKFPVWYVCICLFLRGEPSFLYIAFPTKNAAMVEHYRRGERVEWAKVDEPRGDQVIDAGRVPAVDMAPTDSVGTAWTTEETTRAKLMESRNSSDIPQSEFHQFDHLLEQSLKQPTEVWSHYPAESKEALPGAKRKVYHFLKKYTDDQGDFWYIVIARESAKEDAEQVSAEEVEEGEEQLELLDAIPTRDPGFLSAFRRGELEVGSSTEALAGGQGGFIH